MQQARPSLVQLTCASASTVSSPLLPGPRLSWCILLAASADSLQYARSDMFRVAVCGGTAGELYVRSHNTIEYISLLPIRTRTKDRACSGLMCSRLVSLWVRTTYDKNPV